ncbi:MAG: hypothetical protein U1C46_02880 [Bacteroidales bacterium]|nr:hypothetical protein [Bacteroidales bacterium]MDZ4203743.1 hypothetical protein [Bacteroidales bacterium]
MEERSSAKKFQQLRIEYPWLAYESFRYGYDQGVLWAEFHFNLAGKYSFRPTFRIENRPFYQHVDEAAIENLVFHIGMVEMISYWKAACPPRVIIKPFFLNPEAQAWWRKLFFHGLGEFFHTNGILPGYDDVVNFEFEGANTNKPFSLPVGRGDLLPVGGGKDSALSLALLTGANRSVIPFLLNPVAASIQLIVRAGLALDEAVVVHRTIDPTLLWLNAQGFLNGHTPFSALLAFMALLGSTLTGSSNIVLSNESSANEATIPGTTINHQYSKSFEFEKDFRRYYQQHISADFNYFSFLRPINELQIAGLFAKLKSFHPVFRSCNAGSKTGEWCGKCPKCLFTYIILSPLMPGADVEAIFGRDLFSDADLRTYFNQLCGLTEEKPFDCIGTIGEVNAALAQTIRNKDTAPLPLLLNDYAARQDSAISRNFNFEHLMQQFHHEHFLPQEFESILKTALDESIS